jgi:hypothetical protein
LLESHDICDYSLLVGVHPGEGSTIKPNDKDAAEDCSKPECEVEKQKEEKEKEEIELGTSPGRRKRGWLTASANIRQGKRPTFREHHGGVVARDENEELLDEVYFLGVIDILTIYNFKKKSEHTFKSLLYDSVGNPPKKKKQTVRVC